jgi:hypothetical protein
LTSATLALTVLPMDRREPTPTALALLDSQYTAATARWTPAVAPSALHQ